MTYFQAFAQLLAELQDEHWFGVPEESKLALVHACFSTLQKAILTLPNGHLQISNPNLDNRRNSFASVQNFLGLPQTTKKVLHHSA